MNQTFGFFTVATGDAHYFKIAVHLLRSYRHFSRAPLPFAILTDRENEYTQQFDRCVLMDKPTGSYLDKLALYDHLPFDTSIFIDADCLAYGDLNSLFDHFRDADDFSCFGRVLPLTDRTGWFNYEDLGKLQPRISYCVGLHGGIYYIRKSTKAAAVFTEAKQIAENYPKYNFKGNFSSPGDEPILALSMALNSCHPIPFRSDCICCYWEHEGGMYLSIPKGEAVVHSTGATPCLVHWGTRFTRQLLYQKQIAALELVCADRSSILSNLKYDVRISLSRVLHFGKRVVSKLRRILTRVFNLHSV